LLLLPLAFAPAATLRCCKEWQVNVAQLTAAGWRSVTAAAAAEAAAVARTVPAELFQAFKDA
jgi:hypothetical protein